MLASPLPADLRTIASHLRRCAKDGLGLSPIDCGRIAVLVHEAAHQADVLVATAADMPELEDELLAVAHDLDRVAGDGPQPSFQAALKEQQRVLQAQLDGAGPVHVSRPGAALVRLATPIGDSNVVSFPRGPRPHPVDGGDAA